MKISRIPLSHENAFLDSYLHENYLLKGQKGDQYPEKRPAMLVIPGGGYSNVSLREGEPVALKYYNEGYECFVLNYALRDTIKIHRPEIDGRDALLKILKLPSVDTDRIVLIGFSAGGHVAASIANHAEELGVSGVIKAMILGYPVITMDERYAHMGSRMKITCSLDPKLLDYYSLEKNIPDKYPDVFIWTTSDDELVPVKNSLLLFEALVARGYKAELHIYPSGVHGLALATGETGIINMYVSHWFSESVRFLEKTIGGII